MAAAAKLAAPVYGLSHDLPEGLQLSTSAQFQHVPRAKRQEKAWGVECAPRPAQGEAALVRGPGRGQEDVHVDGRFGPLVEKVGGNSDHVRMGLPVPGFQRKWWYEASATEQEVSLIQAAKTNARRRELAPPEPGEFFFIQQSIQDRLGKQMLEAAKEPSPAAPIKEASLFVPGQQAQAADAEKGEPERPFDIVVYGASGFTGCLIVEHLDAIFSEPKSQKHRWALGGRNLEKLMEMAGRCRTDPSVIKASAPEELAAMAAASRVVIAAAGPYSVCGRAVVEACVESGTHYVDVTGESSFVHDMVEAYHQRARDRGIMVVHCAGQIAAPDDINCYLLAKRLGPLKWFREYWNSVDAITGGTFNTSIFSLRQMADAEVLRVEADPFSLGGRRSCGVRPEDEDCHEAERDAEVFPGTWLQTTYNSRPGSRLVRRSCELFETSPSDGVAYGESLSVTIREPAASQKAAAKSAEENRLPTSAEAAELFSSMMTGRQERGEVPPPGQGPPPQLRARHWSEIFAVAESERGEKAYVRYTGPQSYEVTAMSSAAVALVLVEEPEALKAAERGGVLTPAFAMHGSTWIERLQERSFANGSGKRMRFELVPGTPAAAVLKQGMTNRMRDFAVLQGELSAGALRAWDLPALVGP